jgi:hypothetical protein
MSSYARHDITLFASVVAAKPRSDEREPPMSTSAPGPQAATMQERNKPIEPPKAPAEAPFFLRTIPGADPHPRLPSALSTLSTLSSVITVSTLSTLST